MLKHNETTPPDASWTQGEWDTLWQAAALPLQPYSSQQDKVSHAYGVLPYVSGRSVRLVAPSLSRAWLEQLLSFPMSGHDAVDATVAALEPWANQPAEQVALANSGNS